MPDLDHERYISLATFRRDGRVVETPVWFALDAERLYVFSAGDAGKVKRLRNSARARVTPCDFRGRLHGEPRDATARILDEAQGIERAYAALHAKYGWQMRLSDWLSRITGRLQQRAILEIVLA